MLRKYIQNMKLLNVKHDRTRTIYCSSLIQTLNKLYACNSIIESLKLLHIHKYYLVFNRRDDMSRLLGKPTMWFPNRSNTNRPVQAQKWARSLKFRIKVEEELCYPSSENKDADQLRGYREADLRLCFRLCRLLVFPWCGSYFHAKNMIIYKPR